MSWGIYLFFRRPSWRLPLAAVGVAGALVMFLAFDQVKTALYTLGGGQEFMQERPRYLVMPNGQEVHLHSGTDHRWMLFMVYEKQLREAGLFGYGYGETGDMIEDERVRKKFYSIDNNLIYYVVTYGYLGTVVFLLVVLLPLQRLERVALDQSNPLAPLSAGVFGAAVALNLAVSAVALTRTYAVFWMFLAGLAVSLGQMGWRVEGGGWRVEGGRR